MSEEPQKPHPLEWIPLGIELLLLAALAYRHGHPTFLKGQLLPSMALGFAPGTLMRLAGRPSLGAHRIGISLGLITFMVTNGTLKWGQLKGVLTRPALVLPAMLMILTQPLLGAWRWWLLLKSWRITLRFREALRLTLVGCFFNVFVPGATGGDIFRAYYIARGGAETGATTRGAIATVLLDRLLGLPPLMLLVVGAGFWNSAFVMATPQLHTLAWLIGLATITGGLTFITLLSASHWLHDHLRERAPEWPGGAWLIHFIQGLVACRGRGRVLALAFLIGLLSHALTLVAAGIFGGAAGVAGIPAERYALLVPIGLTVNAIPGAPGGLGQGEMAFAKVFEIAAAGNGAAGALIMICLRTGMILTGLVGGLLYAFGRKEIDAARAAAAVSES